jgi:hypothetical protein
MNMQQLCVELRSGPYQARIFADEYRFRNHVNSHFCNSAEGWGPILGTDLLAEVCQKSVLNDVSIMTALYSAVANAIRRGARFSASLPLYAILREKVRSEHRRPRKVETLYFIAREGFIIVSVNKIVCTAYFPGCCARDSERTLFQKAWRNVKCKCNQNEYHDSKYGVRHKVLNVQLESRDNWQRCPFPCGKSEHGHDQPPSTTTVYQHEAWERRIASYEED